MPVVFVDVTIVPIGTGTTSISDYVAACERILKDFPDVRYRLNPMSTSLEGELESVLALIRKMHEAPFVEGALRVSTSIRIDDRRDHQNTLENKIAVVQKKAGLS